MKIIATHQDIYRDIQAEQLWRVWADVNHRHQWDTDTEWAKLDGKFTAGSTFRFKPKGGPALRMRITEATPNRSFTDCFSLWIAKLYGIHVMEPIGAGLQVTTHIAVSGPGRWLMQKMLAENIAKTIPEQTQQAIDLARQR